MPLARVLPFNKGWLEPTDEKNDEFNLAFVKQLDPHWESLALGDTLLKFTGDGWLVMTNDVDQLPVLCCLALVQAKKFQSEMSERTGTDPAKIPPLRIALCAGRDIPVTLANGHEDWVGDSVRRADRATQFCGTLKQKTSANEILVHKRVREDVERDFYFGEAEMSKRVPVDKQSEEELDLFLLIGLKLETCLQPDAPPHFLYTLGVTEPDELEKVAEQLIERGAKLATDSQQRQRIIGDLKAMIPRLPYPSRSKMAERMKAKKLTDQLTSNILNSMKKTGGYS